MEAYSSRRRSSVLAATLAVAAFGDAALFAGFAHAAVVYQDDFARTGPLAGSIPSPTTVGTTAWSTQTTESTSFNTTAANVANGTTNELVETATSSGAGSAYLPYTMPSTGTTTISAAIEVGASTEIGSNGYGWAGLGFMTDSSHAEMTYNNSPWWYVNSDGGVATFYAGANSVPGVTLSPIANFSNTSFYDFAVSYDAATRTASWYEGSTLEATYTYTSTTAPAITDVVTGLFGSNTSNGVTVNVQNFIVQTRPVPEPSALGLMAMGSLGVLLLGRRRKPA
jgi:hypothetical protein